MKCFPDTSFLCASYREQENSKRADEWMLGLEGELAVSTLLLFEFRQSIRLQNRLFELDRKKGFAPNEGAQILRTLQSDLAERVIKIVEVDWADVHQIAEMLSAKYTTAGGHRFADILHVATALHLASPVFLTFDTNQRKLAEAEGMTVPV
jgi:predicted nucleic acid-binding protein